MTDQALRNVVVIVVIVACFAALVKLWLLEQYNDFANLVIGIATFVATWASLRRGESESE